MPVAVGDTYKGRPIVGTPPFGPVAVSCTWSSQMVSALTGRSLTSAMLRPASLDRVREVLALRDRDLELWSGARERSAESEAVAIESVALLEQQDRRYRIVLRDRLEMRSR